MFSSLRLGFALTLLLVTAIARTEPSVYPTGVTLYDPTTTWNGYTVLTLLRPPGIVVIDMNGRVVKEWDDFNNSAGGPARVLPGGEVIAARGANPGHQESLELVQRDFAGKDLWKLAGVIPVNQPDGTPVPSLRQHHDWQRSDFPAGYYSPESKPASHGSNTLVLTHITRKQPDVTDRTLEDDRLIEFGPDGHITWEWTAGEHADEFGFDAAARMAIRTGAGAGASPAAAAAGASADRGFDWLHINSAAYVGPNHWFDAGDTRFAPENVVISSRQASFIAIINRKGKVAWRIGPDFGQSAALRRIGQIIGQHHAHIIPKGLPGAGNLLVFDNGGQSGYGFPNPIAPNGYGAFARATSRVLEINPVTLELVWSYTPRSGFFSTNISSAQRLQNGNTLITEGAGGRSFEVTSAGKMVWELMNPFFDGDRNDIYRAYRIPYGWLPQARRPRETAVKPPVLKDFHLPSK
ncbi:MAG: aryl-sulfate sulfotransferase [Pseudomonadota bacterium]